MTSRRRFRLDSEREIGNMIDILQNDEDSDIEENTTIIETEEAIDEFGAGQEELDGSDEDIPERDQAPMRTRGRSRITRTGRSRVRSSVRSRSTRSRGRGTVENVQQIDEANGWSYKPVENLPENPVFQDLCIVMPPIDEHSTVFDCFSVFFPDSFWKLLKEETNRYASQMKACGEELVQHASLDDAGPSRGPHHAGMTSRLTGRHFMERIPATGSKTKVARVCKVCADTTKKETGKRGRKETLFYCPDCNVPLCYDPCFKKYHTRKDYTS